MPTYRVDFVGAARKQLRKMDPQIRLRIIAASEALASNPRPVGCKQLVGRPGYRIKVAKDWRVIYEIRDEVLLVMVVKVAHRSESYR
jgi:mRNA interferase RelE/StbE